MEDLFASMIIGLGSGTIIGVIAALVYEHILNKRIAGGRGIKPSATPPPIRPKDEEKHPPHDCQ